MAFVAAIVCRTKIYLGSFNSAENRRKYAHLLAESVKSNPCNISIIRRLPKPLHAG